MKHAEHVHMRLSSVLVVNCEHCRWLSLSWAGIRLECSHSFLLLHSECSKSFESERFTMVVAHVINCGEMFDDCCCASKWE